MKSLFQWSLDLLILCSCTLSEINGRYQYGYPRAHLGPFRNFQRTPSIRENYDYNVPIRPVQNPYRQISTAGIGIPGFNYMVDLPYYQDETVRRNEGRHQVPVRHHSYRPPRYLPESSESSSHEFGQDFDDYRLRYPRRHNAPRSKTLPSFRNTHIMNVPEAVRREKRLSRKEDEEHGSGMKNEAYMNSSTEWNQKNKPPVIENSMQVSLENCLRETHPCQKIIGFSQICEIHCAIKALPNNHPLVPFLSKMAKVLNVVIRGICHPVKTTLELGWKYFVENSKPVHSFVQWQKKMGINVKEQVGGDIEKLGDMLLVQVIKYAQTPLSILRDVFTGDGAPSPSMKQGNTLFQGFNPGCLAQEFQTYANKFVDIFSRDPTMLDVLLSGSALVVNAGKYIPGPHQKMFRTVALANQLLVGTSCGILYWVGVRGATCDQVAANPARRTFTRKSRPEHSYCPSVEREIRIFVD